MKKLLTVLFVLKCVTDVTAQQLVSKRGEPILPEKGNWGVMFDVVPFLKYAGDIFYPSSSNPVFLSAHENTLVLKHYKSDNRALRIKLRIGFTSYSVDSIVQFLGGANPEPSVTDNRTVSKKHIVAGIGTQKSVTKGRVSGYFGKELLFSYSGGDTTYTYGGGPLTQYNWLHTNTFGQGRGVLEITEGNKFSIGFHLVFGAEFFFAPKMSLSAEYSWGLAYEKTGEGKISKEAWEFQNQPPSNGKIKTTSVKIPGSHSFIVDNANNVGSINLAFYF